MNLKLDFFKNKIKTGCSDLEEVVYSEAIVLLNDGVNHDKVNHWVNMTINTFNNKPKPLSDKEKKKREDRRIKKQQKKENITSLNIKIKKFLDNNGVVVIGFFGWEEITSSEYNMLSKLVEKSGYFIDDIGLGVFEPFITKKELNSDFHKKYRNFEDKLEELGVYYMPNEYRTDNIDIFRNKILTLV